MRTTLSIDDDVLAAVRAMAQRQHRSVGELVSTLVRQALQPQRPSERSRNGVSLLPTRPGTAPVTPEFIAELRDELP